MTQTGFVFQPEDFFDLAQADNLVLAMISPFV
jgi:hypothetical protein